MRTTQHKSTKKEFPPTKFAKKLREREFETGRKEYRRAGREQV
jgi:hypothetical protein